jgi:dihydroorotase
MNPPLESREDRDALVQGLLDGTVDCIATDHAPHTLEEKAKGWKKSPFGITGHETAFPLVYTELVKTGKVSLSLISNKMSHDMAKTFGLPTHDIYVGNDANITIIDLNEHYQIDSSTFVSKGQNTPYNGKWVYGKILYTIKRGEIIYGL